MVKLTALVAVAASLGFAAADTTPCPTPADPFAIYEQHEPCTNAPATNTPATTTASPSNTIRFCSYNRQALSEYYGDIYTDVLRNNQNEQFVYSAQSHSITVKSNGECLDAFLDNSGAYQLHTYTCSSTNPNQQWNFNSNTNRIEHLTHNNLCVAAGAAGSKARVEPCSSSLQQYFSDCSSQSTVALQFQTCYTDKYLSEYDTGLYADTRRDNNNEKFLYDPVAQTIKVGSNGQCLDAFPVDGGKFGLHTYNCDASNANQKWVFEDNRIKHATHNNLCLDADPTYNDHHVQVWECFPYNRNQCWNVIHS